MKYVLMWVCKLVISHLKSERFENSCFKFDRRTPANICNDQTARKKLSQDFVTV